jgi:hypothetical protein
LTGLRIGLQRGSSTAAAFCRRGRACAHQSKEVDVPGKKHGPSVEKPKTYEALKKRGMSESRAARIGNARANKSKGKSK